MDNFDRAAFPQSYSGNLMPSDGIGGGLTKRELFAAMEVRL